jgi:Transposase DDE domain
MPRRQNNPQRINAEGGAAMYFTNVSWNIAIMRNIIRALPKSLREWVEPALSQLRARVEHPVHIIKNCFHHKKLRYRGLVKNTAKRHTLFALANLGLSNRPCLSQHRPNDTRSVPRFRSCMKNINPHFDSPPTSSAAVR